MSRSATSHVFIILCIKSFKLHILSIINSIGIEVYPLSKVDVPAVVSNFQIQWQVTMTKNVEVMMAGFLYLAAIHPQVFTFFTLKLLLVFQIADTTFS